MRAAIFIDGGYLQSQLKYQKIDPDYSKLAEFFLSAAEGGDPFRFASMLLLLLPALHVAGSN